MAGVGWTEAETCALIDVWGDADIQNQLDCQQKQAYL